MKRVYTRSHVWRSLSAIGFAKVPFDITCGFTLSKNDQGRYDTKSSHINQPSREDWCYLCVNNIVRN